MPKQEAILLSKEERENPKIQKRYQELRASGISIRSSIKRIRLEIKEGKLRECQS